MKRALSRVVLFVTGLTTGIFLIMLCSFDDKIANETKHGESSKDHNWFAPPLPVKMNFADEEAPLGRWEVKELIDREILFNYYKPDNILYMLKLSERYFTIIEEELRAYGIPDDFKYLCIAESNLTNATSRSGAVGFWQFMKNTAPGFGIEVSETVDERYHVTKATQAACKYLRQAYNRFGSWTAAAASYNCGMGKYLEKVKYQQTNNYYDLLLPEETQRYIFRILAFKYLLINSDSLGFTLQPAERYAPVKTRTLTVNGNIPDLASYAKRNGSNYKVMKLLNPWLRARSLTVKPGKTYTIVLPAD